MNPKEEGNEGRRLGEETDEEVSLGVFTFQLSLEDRVGVGCLKRGSGESMCREGVRSGTACHVW